MFVFSTDLLFESLPDSQSCPEEDFVALEEDQIPDPEDSLPGQAGREEREEPLHRKHVGQGWLVAGPWKNKINKIDVDPKPAAALFN